MKATTSTLPTFLPLRAFEEFLSTTTMKGIIIFNQNDDESITYQFPLLVFYH